MDNSPIKPPPAPIYLPPWVCVAWEPGHGHLFQEFFSLIKTRALYFNTAQARAEPCFLLKSTKELQSLLNVSLGSGQIESQSELLSDFEKIICYSPHLSHPFYLDGGGLDAVGIIGDWMGTIMSGPACIYITAPVFTLMEFEIYKELINLIWGETKGQTRLGKGDGAICPGPEFSLILALLSALHWKWPDRKQKGLPLSKAKPLVFISQDGNAFMENICQLVGLGSSGCIRVKVDDTTGKMSLDHLKSLLSNVKGGTPCFLVVTLGTDRTGAVDGDMEELSTLCEQHKMWFHVDGNGHAGGYVFSDNLRPPGLHLADSFSLGGSLFPFPQCCNVLVTKWPGTYETTFIVQASDTFTPQGLYENGDDNQSDTLQTCRRADVAKLWLYWKVHGISGISGHVEDCANLAKYLLSQLTKRGSTFHITSCKAIESPRICFYYVPQHLRSLPRNMDGSNAVLARLTTRLQKSLLKDGGIYVGLQAANLSQNCPPNLVVTLTNCALSFADVDYIVEMLMYFGERVEFSGAIITGKARPVLPPPSTSYPSWVSAPIEEMHGEMFDRFFTISTQSGLYFQDKRNEPPIRFLEPDELKQRMDFSLGKDGAGLDIIGKLWEDTIFYNPHQSHPYHIFQVNAAGLDPYAIMGDLISATMTSKMRSYTDNPLYFLMEEEVKNKTAGQIDTSSHSIGTKSMGFVLPGGSISNMTVMHSALNSRPRRPGSGHPTAFVSEDAHYSFMKGSITLGLGLDGLVLVRAGKDGKMDLADLRQKIETCLASGGDPYFVAATVGTTEVGVSDPVKEISELCAQYKVWFHIDGAIGGCRIFSGSNNIPYIETSDSFTMNWHKWLASPMLCSVMIYKNSQRWNGLSAVELSSQNPFQVARRPNILKVWTQWKAKGSVLLGAHIDACLDRTEFLIRELHSPKRTPMFWCYDVNPIVPYASFYYLPKILRNVKDKSSPAFKKRLDSVAIPLMSRLILSGSMFIGIIQPEQGTRRLMRFVLMNSSVTNEDVVYLLDKVDEIGQDMTNV